MPWPWWRVFDTSSVCTLPIRLTFTSKSFFVALKIFYRNADSNRVLSWRVVHMSDASSQLYRLHG